MKKQWMKFWNLAKYWLGVRPKWRECRRASCWFGANANVRIMNLLSPHFTERQFKDRVAMCEKRGVDTFHLFLANQKDGEAAGYMPSEAKLSRVKWLARRGYGIVLWLVADDSSGYWRQICKDPAAFVKSCRPFLGYASTVVLGLEMDEYGSLSQWTALRDALRREWRGKIGTHHTSGRATFAGLGDILFYQVEPGKSASEIKKGVSAALSHGKPVCMFELSRHEDRALCEAALAAGAFAVGNW